MAATLKSSDRGLSVDLLNRATKGKMPTQEEIEQMLTIPDTAPLAALLSRRARWKEHKSWLPRRAYLRGVELLEGRSALPWNEVLDILAVSRRLWPEGEPGVMGAYRLTSDVYQWVSSRATEEDLVQLLSFREEKVVLAVAAEAKVVSRELLDVFIAEHPLHVDALLNNTATSHALLRRARRWAVESVSAAIGEHQNDAKAVRTKIEPGIKALRTIAHRSPAILGDDFTSLALGWARTEFQGSERDASVLKYILGGVLGLDTRHVEARDAMEVAGFIVKASRWGAEKVARDSKSSIHLLRAFAGMTHAIRVREALTQNKAAMVDEEILSTLSHSKSGKIAGEVLKKATGKAFKRSFKCVVESAPSEALSRLEERFEEVADVLVPKDLAPVFSDESAAIRERALRTVHRVVGARNNSKRQ